MSDAYVWSVILGLGAATFAIRFSFLGLLGSKSPPPLLERALAFTPVAVIPALVAPLVAFDRDAGTLAAPPAWIGAAAALAAGMATRALLPAIVGGMAAFHLARLAGL